VIASFSPLALKAPEPNYGPESANTIKNPGVSTNKGKMNPLVQTITIKMLLAAI